MKISRFDYWFLAIVFLFNLIQKLVRLNIPDHLYFDEKAYFIPAARDYLSGGYQTELTHPFVGKLFMAAGIFAFGDNVWGWRIPEVVVGSLGVVFIYLLSKAMFGGRFVPILACVFLTFEFSWFLFSRLGTLEIYVATFSLAAAFFFWRFLQTEKNLFLVLTGVSFGLAIGSKWNGVFLLVFVGVYYVWFQREELFQAGLRMLALGALAFGGYIATFVFYLQNHSLSELLDLHLAMYNFHSGGQSKVIEESSGIIVSQLGYLYSPLAWVFNYVTVYWAETSDNSSKIIGQFYNPALFWGGLVAILVSIKKLGKDREKMFLVGAFLVFWIPWIFISRIAYPYYLLPAVPFGIILLSRVVEENFERRKFLLTGLVVIVVLSFLFYYPIITAVNIPTWYLRLLTGGRA